jgi:hypothetical protein
LFTELGVGMVAAINVVPATEQHGLGYTDPASIDQQAVLVRKYTGKPADPEPPAAASYVVNLPPTELTLSAAEWQSVREKNAKYLKLLGAA